VSPTDLAVCGHRICWGCTTGTERTNCPECEEAFQAEDEKWLMNELGDEGVAMEHRDPVLGENRAFRSEKPQNFAPAASKKPNRSEE